MLNFEGRNIYLACGATDLRKSIDGLSVIVAARFKMSPFEDSIFVFCNRARNGIKILEWDKNGFWLHYKRLDRGHFNWPKAGDSHRMELTAMELQTMLEGTKLIQKLKRQQVTPLHAC